jgi:hypothetical protein
MSDSTDTPLARLTAALDDLAAALASADLARLLAVEPVLASALEGMAGPATTADRDAIDRARAALLRCRRLGAGLTAFARLSLEPAGAPVYSRLGADALVDGHARSSSMEARG